MNIPWDLEGTPLQIKTSSTLGSDVIHRVDMYDKDGTFVTAVGVMFSSSMNYYIGHCASYTPMQVQPPLEVDKIWTFTKTETALIITCNAVDVLNYLFADSSYGGCATKLGGDVVKAIQFLSQQDTASQFYRAGKAPTYKKVSGDWPSKYLHDFG